MVVDGKGTPVLYLRESNGPVTCAGVLVLPGDVMVGDAEGVVVIPAAMAEEVACDALEQEEHEAWSLERVDAGESVRGVYPISAERLPEFEAWWRSKAAWTEGSKADSLEEIS